MYRRRPRFCSRGAVGSAEALYTLGLAYYPGDVSAVHFFIDAISNKLPAPYCCILLSGSAVNRS